MVLSQDQSFAGKRVLIAGASRGLGRETARAMAAAEAHLALGSRDDVALQAVLSDLPGTGHFAASADFSTAQGCKDWAGRAQTALGGVDVLLVTVTAGAADRTEDNFRASFETDLMAPIRLIEACRDGLLASRGAVLVCSSRTARGHVPQTMAYGAAKVGLEHAVTCLAAEFADKAVRINAIAPGSTRFDGGFWDWAETERPDLYRRTLEKLPAGRLGTADDILPAVMFLCSDAARWITGQTLLVDGGQTLATD